MPRAQPSELIDALRELGVGLIDKGNDVNLADRPNLLLRRLERAGYQFRRTKPLAQDLAALGFEPKTVFDIGVDAGTPLIYNAFPDAHFVLADPVRESEARVEPWRKRIDFEFHNCAVGSANGHTTLSIPSTKQRTRHSRASVKDYDPTYSDKFAEIETRRVRMVTLDTLSAGQKPPFGLKLDTEGSEMDVILGASETLRETEFVLAEVSVRERFLGGYKFSEFVGEMGRNGFEPLLFLREINPKDNDCDLIFARVDGPHFRVRD